MLDDLRNFRLIGRGGFSTVYVADQPRLGRSVAVKLLDLRLGDDASWQRFERECLIGGTLSAVDGVATIHAAGRTDAGVPYIVMEFLEGGSIRDLVRAAGPLDSRQAAQVGLAAAGALAVAHESGILHRDVKPENLLIDRAGKVKLGDFGISSAAGNITRDGTSTDFYTPDHVAPEVLRGEPALRPADVYSLCSALYFALEGHSPFRAEPEDSIAVIITRKLNGPFLPFVLAPRSTLTDVISAGLADEPASRPTAAEIAVALESSPRRPLWVKGAEILVPIGGLAEVPVLHSKIGRTTGVPADAATTAPSWDAPGTGDAARRRDRRWALAFAVSVVALVLGIGEVALARSGRSLQVGAATTLVAGGDRAEPSAARAVTVAGAPTVAPATTTAVAPTSQGGPAVVVVASGTGITGPTSSASVDTTTTATTAASAATTAAPTTAVPITTATGPAVPPAPAITSAVAWTHQVTLLVSSPAAASVIDYLVVWRPNGVAPPDQPAPLGGSVVAGPSGTVVIPGLMNGAGYTFSVSARNALGPGLPATTGPVYVTAYHFAATMNSTWNPKTPSQPVPIRTKPDGASGKQIDQLANGEVGTVLCQVHGQSRQDAQNPPLVSDVWDLLLTARGSVGYAPDIYLGAPGLNMTRTTICG